MDKDKLGKAAPVVSVLAGMIAACALAGYIIDQWPVIDAAFKPPIISGAFTILAAMGGALVVFWQLRRQAVNTINANRTNEAMKLKKDVYEELRAACGEALEARRRLTRFLNKFLTDVNLARSALEIHNGPTPRRPRARVKPLMKKQNRASEALNQLITLQEKWEIIDPRGYIFRTALAHASDKVWAAWHRYFEFAITHMPRDREPSGMTFQWEVPNDNEYAWLTRLTGELVDALSLEACYIGDLQTEMQNALLGEMFDGKQVPVRQPLDPKYRAITLAKHEELKRFFDETDFGKRMTAAKEAARNAQSAPQD